jgi:hypothetical protein
MNRAVYFNYIEEKLNTLATRINARGKLNILDLHGHSENFYPCLLNELFGWNLRNLNDARQNVEAIDLIDDSSKIIVQVSATNTKAKVEAALKKKIINEYREKSFTFKFISISKDASSLRKATFVNPHGITFNPASDILDIILILRHINNLQEIDKFEKIYDLTKKELGGQVDVVRLDSNLATIINILSKEKFDGKDSSAVNSFEIERKIAYNNLDSAKYIINDYKIYYSRLDKKYAEFDSQGFNKSNSVLAAIKKEYLKAKKAKNDDDLFFEVIKGIQQRVVTSANYATIPVEELEVCIDVLVVDAFIRCKIFENPKGYNYVAA